MKQRKVGNILALAVLAALSRQPMHPYELASSLRGWGKDQDMEIKWGSLYTVVRNMDKHGLIEATESVREGKRPERTVYRITEAGRAELLDWVRELISTAAPEYPRFKAGLSVVMVLRPDEAISLLQQRLGELEEQIDKAHATLAQSAEVPRLFLIEVEYDLAMKDAEANWMRQLLAEFTSGDFAGMQQWRAFNDTGEVPDDLAEMAKRHME